MSSRPEFVWKNWKTLAIFFICLESTFEGVLNVLHTKDRASYYSVWINNSVNDHMLQRAIPLLGYGVKLIIIGITAFNL